MKKSLMILPVCLFACEILLAGAPVRLADLRCEYLTDPLGIDAARPRISWVIESDRRGERQTAYQVLAASSAEALAADRGDLWDSGKVDSDASIGIAYAGMPLASGADATWKVRVWDRDGKPSGWSAPALWSVGLLSKVDWRGQWIARTDEKSSQPAPLFRKEFSVDGKVRRARLYIAGLGYHEVRLNGKKVGDHVLDPGYTRYDRRVLYVIHDVTGLLAAGKNAIGAILGNGWFNVHTKAVWNFHDAPWRASPRLLLELRIDLDDGKTQVVASDASWRTSTGPIVFDSIYAGETYDARLEKPGWDAPGFDDSSWDRAKAAEAPRGVLAAQMGPPIRVSKVLEPAKISEPRPGVFVVDLGQNLAGRARIILSGPAGTQVRLRYGEKLNADGTLDQSNIAMHQAKEEQARFQTDIYILKGAGEETWESRFTYHGFQYVEVTGWPGKPAPGSIRGLFHHTDVEYRPSPDGRACPAGTFECSNPLLDKIWQASLWSYLSNLQSIPTDCPHREKNGWTGDAHLAAEQAFHSFFPPAMNAKWVDDLADEQRPTGELPGIVPTGGWGYAWGNGPAWDSAFILIPWYQYLYCGDLRILEEHYEGFRRYVDYLGTKSDKGIVSIGLGDWCPWKAKTPEAVTSTGYYHRDLLIVAETAKLLGKADDEKKYREIAAAAREAFRKRFVNPETGVVATGSQCAQACALYQDLVEDRDGKVRGKLLEAIEKAGGHIDTGILGAKYVLNVLIDSDPEAAYGIVSKKTIPGWGHWIEQGATTLWESWKGDDSRNHIMFGDVSAWMYKALAGIRCEAPGWARIAIRPQPAGDLTFARGEVRTIRGTVASGWRIEGGKLRLDVTIPANATAEVHVPGAAGKVTEGGRPASEAQGVKLLRTAGDGKASIYEVGSGTYRFEAPRS
jgi:alpha-L-rhamnosidase